MSLAAVALLTLLAGTMAAAPSVAASLVADAQTLGVNADAAARLPASRTFTVSTAGQVRVTLRDLGTPTGVATGFTQLQAVISQGVTKVASFSVPGTLQFDAVPGLYKVQVIGTAVAPAGTFDVVAQALPANTTLLQFADGIQAAPSAGNPAQSTLDTTFDITQPGSYQVTLTDRSFPAALTSVDLLLLRTGSAPVTLSGPCSVSACSANFTVASAGSYNLLIVASAAGPDQSGLYSVSVGGGPSSATAYASTQPVGLLNAPLAVTLPAGGGFTLSLADFSTPAPLADLRAMVVQGAASLGSLSTAGSVPLTGGAAGSAGLYLFRKAASGAGAAAGSYGVSIAQGASTVYRDARPVPEGYDATANFGGYRYAFNIAANADYRSQLRDLAFPSAFATLRGVIVQNGSVAQSLNAAGTSTTTLTTGSAIALVFGSPATAGGNSLFGLSIAPSAGGAPAVDQAQGVGPLIATRQFDITTAGSHDLTVNDLLFPVGFAELAVAVTEGSGLVGQIFGGGKITFNAAAGPHFVSLLARPTNTAEYATWGFDVSTTPPAPTLTITASPASVASGSTTSLTWTAANATSCTASGGWTGTKALSGTETSAALTVDTAFTLTCVGTGGSLARTANVTISAAAAPGGGGGGGRLDVTLLAGLLLVLAAHAARRRAAQQ